MSKQYTSQEKRTRNLKYAAIILAVIFVVSAFFFGMRIVEKLTSPQFENDEGGAISTDVKYKGEEYVLKDNIETVLILGLDKFEEADADSYNNDKQADFLMLLVVDHENQTCTTLHINRDTMAEMNVLGVAGDPIDTVVKQLALAHTYGNGKEVSCRNTKDAVSKLLMNVEIDHYLSVKMDAVSVYNDLLGGVEVTVLDDFSGIDDTLVEGETVTLLGEHALKYVRTRKGLEDSSNSRRMVRQRQYIKALYEKTSQVVDADSGFIVNAASQLAQYIVTDFTGTRLQSFAETIKDYDFAEEIYELEGKNKVGEKHMEFYPDEDSIEEIVIKLFYEPQK